MPTQPGMSLKVISIFFWNKSCEELSPNGSQLYLKRTNGVLNVVNRQRSRLSLILQCPLRELQIGKYFALGRLGRKSSKLLVRPADRFVEISRVQVETFKKMWLCYCHCWVDPICWFIYLCPFFYVTSVNLTQLSVFLWQLLELVYLNVSLVVCRGRPWSNSCHGNKCFPGRGHCTIATLPFEDAASELIDLVE